MLQKSINTLAYMHEDKQLNDLHLWILHIDFMILKGRRFETGQLNAEEGIYVVLLNAC